MSAIGMATADALQSFEALVLSQVPATEPWTPVTDYTFAARQIIEGPHAALIQETFRPTRVLDAGCGPGHLVHLLRAIGVDAVGVDRVYWPMAPAIVRDLAEPDPAPLPGRYDLVICREVLEHLTVLQIRHAVTNLCRWTTRYVYVTTRFAQASDHLLRVDTSDDLDPTHISLLHPTLLRLLFVLEGFRRRADLETQLDWKHLGRVLVYERA